MAIISPAKIRTSIQGYLDDKIIFPTLTDLYLLPISQRERGMKFIVQFGEGGNTQEFWLPTDDLSNSGLVEYNTSTSDSAPRWQS